MWELHADGPLGRSLAPFSCPSAIAVRPGSPVLTEYPPKSCVRCVYGMVQRAAVDRPVLPLGGTCRSPSDALRQVAMEIGEKTIDALSKTLTGRHL